MSTSKISPKQKLFTIFMLNVIKKVSIRYLDFPKYTDAESIINSFVAYFKSLPHHKKMFKKKFILNDVKLSCRILIKLNIYV